MKYHKHKFDTLDLIAVISIILVVFSLICMFSKVIFALGCIILLLYALVRLTEPQVDDIDNRRNS